MVGLSDLRGFSQPKQLHDFMPLYVYVDMHIYG